MGVYERYPSGKEAILSAARAAEEEEAADAEEDLDPLADLAARVGRGTIDGDELREELVALARRRLAEQGLSPLAALADAAPPWLEDVDWERLALAVADGLRTWAKYRRRRR